MSGIRTVRGHGIAEIIVKKSRFVAQTTMAESEEEARDFIDRVKAEHKGATHNVSAYRVGKSSVIERFDDDGEPSGTAGLPVLSVIIKEGLVDVVVVVTRYFGGILLGARGLVRAYGEAAKEAIHAAGISVREPCREVLLEMDYSPWVRVQSLVEMRGYPWEDISYTDRVRLVVLVPVGEVAAFGQALRNFRGVNFREGQVRYAAVGPGKEDK